MKKIIEPFSTTGIGSLPHTNTDEACRLVLESVDIPFWPQLPQLSFHEFMIPQYSEGLPFLKIDEKNQRVWVERDESDELTRFYESYSDDSKISISDNYAKGFSLFLRSIGDRRFHVLKGHVTGPLTFTLGMKDSDGKYIFYDEEIREISLLLLKAKVRWQVACLKPFAEHIIIFIDEPVLSALGTSSYIGVSPDESLRLLREVSDSVKLSGAIPGIHCCSKADWQLVIQTDVSIINFDAYDYAETIALYPNEFTHFLNSGGYLAWGIVPTTDAIKTEDTASVRKRFDSAFASLSKSLPADLLRSQLLLTPSCGAGSLNQDEAEKVFQILGELKKSIQSDFS